MEYPDFREICFFCAEDNSYFIPEDLYDKTVQINASNKLEALSKVKEAYPVASEYTLIKSK